MVCTEIVHYIQHQNKINNIIIHRLYESNYVHTKHLVYYQSYCTKRDPTTLRKHYTANLLHIQISEDQTEPPPKTLGAQPSIGGTVSLAGDGPHGGAPHISLAPPRLRPHTHKRINLYVDMFTGTHTDSRLWSVLGQN